MSARRFERSDPEFLRDIADAAEKIIEWTATRPHDDMYKSAVVEQLQIIGEAAQAISEAKRNEMPEVPWRQMIAMRHRLRHECWDTDWAQIEITIAVDLPPLKEVISNAWKPSP